MKLFTKRDLAEMIVSHNIEGDLPPKILNRCIKKLMKISENLFYEELHRTDIHVELIRRNLFHIV